MSFNCFDFSGKKITTNSYLDCSPSLPIEMTASEFASIANASSITIDDLLAIPPLFQLQEFFMLGFKLPMTIYLVSWAYGVVINFVNSK